MLWFDIDHVYSHRHETNDRIEAELSKESSIHRLGILSETVEPLTVFERNVVWVVAWLGLCAFLLPAPPIDFEVEEGVLIWSV